MVELKSALVIEVDGYAHLRLQSSLTVSLKLADVNARDKLFHNTWKHMRHSNQNQAFFFVVVNHH